MTTVIYLRKNGKLKKLVADGFFTHEQLKASVYQAIGPFTDARFMVVYR